MKNCYGLGAMQKHNSKRAFTRWPLGWVKPETQYPKYCVCHDRGEATPQRRLLEQARKLRQLFYPSEAAQARIMRRETPSNTRHVRCFRYKHGWDTLATLLAVQLATKVDTTLLHFIHAGWVPSLWHPSSHQRACFSVNCETKRDIVW